MKRLFQKWGSLFFACFFYIGRQGSTGVITGNLTADTGSSLEAWLQGSGARLDGQVEDENLDHGISSDAGITLHLKDGAVSNLEGEKSSTGTYRKK